jgi:N-dimethylarginine dimethylaminohydrolase
MDSIYVRDASIATNDGMLICNMGKEQRSGEPKMQMEHYLQNGQPVSGSFQNEATIEGGDVAWLNDEVITVARGYRTNREGIDQLRHLVKNTAERVVVMDSPHYKGPSDVFHLMSVLSPVDKDLAVVYSPLMTVPFRELLLSMGINFVEVPDEEFDSLGSNVLAIAPRVCLMVKGNTITKSRLETAGEEVIEFGGSEICLKVSGGPTCLTRPLERQV